MLVLTHRSRRTLSRRAVLGLVAMAVLICGVPTFLSEAAQPRQDAGAGVVGAVADEPSSSGLGSGVGVPGEVAEKPLSIAEAGNQFALDLYAQLGKSQPGNLFFSPSSISIALTMTAGGARGQTQAEMAQVLRLGNQLDAAHGEYRRLLAKWNGPGEDRKYQLRMANRLWIQDGYPLMVPFAELTGTDYGAVIAPVDYTGDPEGSRAVINQWVLERTERKIRDLLPRGSIGRDARLVLTNAVYFKADWVKEFDRNHTSVQFFFVSADRQVGFFMMGGRETFGYAETTDVQVLEMPYRGDELSMVVVLPREVEGLADVEGSLSADRLAGWLGAIVRREVDVTLPKFKIEASLKLNETLEAMGMKQAFSLGADFTGISDQEELSISDVLHKGIVAVDEKGTEAAVATAFIMQPGGLNLISDPVPTFRADHPFLFLIRDMKSNSILFMGRLVEPAGEVRVESAEEL